MTRSTRSWNGAFLGILGGGLALGLWYASSHYELPPANSTATGSTPRDAGGSNLEQHEADAFARLAMETLRAAGIQGVSYDPERFLLQVPDADGQQPFTVFLSNFHAEYLAAPPERRGEVLQRLLSLHTAPKVPEAYAAVRSELLPVVRPRSYFELAGLLVTSDKAQPAKAPVSWQPVGDVMAVAVVHDGPDTMRYIDPEQLARWGVSFDTARADALENLRRRSTEPLEQLAPGTCASAWRDNYDTSRLLLEELVRRCPVRGEPVVLLPHRDLLLITGSRDEQGLVLAAERAAQALNAPRAQDGRALRLTSGGWVPFLPERGHRAWPAFHRLAMSSLARDYTEQEERLHQLHERQGVDLFIAGFLVAQDEDENGPSR
ncbi:MAG TPA: DUF1444 family protein, partial [Archangium sp.]|nr:DUF1444 family protein [Archangium sp.]